MGYLVRVHHQSTTQLYSFKYMRRDGYGVEWVFNNQRVSDTFRDKINCLSFWENYPGYRFDRITRGLVFASWWSWNCFEWIQFWILTAKYMILWQNKTNINCHFWVAKAKEEYLIPLFFYPKLKEFNIIYFLGRSIKTPFIGPVSSFRKWITKVSCQKVR